VETVGHADLQHQRGSIARRWISTCRKTSPRNRRQRRHRSCDSRIIARMNQVEDPEIAAALCDASCAGVPIDLIVSGLCCLRPGIPGHSETIRVRSIIGRFLEHSRIFPFAAGQADPVEGELLIGSADWMFRNLSGRVARRSRPESARTAVGDPRDRARRSTAGLGDARRWELSATGARRRRRPLGSRRPSDADGPRQGADRRPSAEALQEEVAPMRPAGSPMA
jgi:polyphosphate kinase